jgi:pyrroline-5-carboxylate reductase
MVGKGASCYALGPATDTDDASLADKILGSLGIARQVDEAQLDAVTALSGSGPAYFFEMIQGLVDAAVQQGLDESLALDLSVQTMAGAAEMLARKLGTPDELRIAVTSKKGTTEAGLNVLAKAEFRKILAMVVKAAKDRSVELGLGKQ